MELAILSDSHGLLRRRVAEETQKCACILHAGDIIKPGDLDELALYGRLYAVKGNCDLWVPGLSSLSGLLRFTIEGVSFCMVHDPADVPKRLEGVDAVIHGHTHVYREEWIDGKLWLNPGSCGRSRFGADPTMAVMTVKDGKIIRVKRIDMKDYDD